MVQPALMMALKPESVGRPPGVATMTPTTDNKVNGNVNFIENSSLHPGAIRTGQAKAEDAASAPTIMAEKNREAKRDFLHTMVTKNRDKRIEPRQGTRRWVGISLRKTRAG